MLAIGIEYAAETTCHPSTLACISQELLGVGEILNEVPCDGFILFTGMKGFSLNASTSMSMFCCWCG
jgi:hypothetical protein